MYAKLVLELKNIVCCCKKLFPCIKCKQYYDIIRNPILNKMNTSYHVFLPTKTLRKVCCMQDKKGREKFGTNNIIKLIILRVREEGELCRGCQNDLCHLRGSIFCPTHMGSYSLLQTYQDLKVFKCHFRP